MTTTPIPREPVMVLLPLDPDYAAELRDAAFEANVPAEQYIVDMLEYARAHKNATDMSSDLLSGLTDLAAVFASNGIPEHLLRALVEASLTSKHLLVHLAARSDPTAMASVAKLCRGEMDKIFPEKKTHD